MPIFAMLCWVLMGLFFLVAEAMVPGFILFFFGLGAFVTALVGAFVALSITLQVTLFVGSSIVLLVLGKCCFKRTFTGKQMYVTADADDTTFVGRKVVVTERITPDRPGRVEVNGSTWPAAAEATFEVGERVQIIARENLTFFVAN